MYRKRLTKNIKKSFLNSSDLDDGCALNARYYTENIFFYTYEPHMCTTFVRAPPPPPPPAPRWGGEGHVARAPGEGARTNVVHI